MGLVKRASGLRGRIGGDELQVRVRWSTPAPRIAPIGQRVCPVGRDHAVPGREQLGDDVGRGKPGSARHEVQDRHGPH